MTTLYIDCGVRKIFLTKKDDLRSSRVGRQDKTIIYFTNHKFDKENQCSKPLFYWTIMIIPDLTIFLKENFYKYFYQTLQNNPKYHTKPWRFWYWHGDPPKWKHPQGILRIKKANTRNIITYVIVVFRWKVDWQERGKFEKFAINNKKVRRRTAHSMRASNYLPVNGLSSSKFIFTVKLFYQDKWSQWIKKTPGESGNLSNDCNKMTKIPPNYIA